MDGPKAEEVRGWPAKATRREEELVERSEPIESSDCGNVKAKNSLNGRNRSNKSVAGLQLIKSEHGK